MHILITKPIWDIICSNIYHHQNKQSNKQQKKNTTTKNNDKKQNFQNSGGTSNLKDSYFHANFD